MKLLAKTIGRTFRLFRDAWVVVGVTAIALLALESGLRRYYNKIDSRIETARPNAARDYRLDADAYEGAPWVPALYAELNAIWNQFDWHSYVGWRSRPYSGTHINIDERGLRRTWSAANLPDHPLRVFVFGGSTAWGAGSRDDFTLPSALAKYLAENGIAAEVTNFGQNGYLSTQELLAFCLELQAGNRPDVAIFLDGVNDVMIARQIGMAGIPADYETRTVEYGLSSRLLRSSKDELRKIYFHGVLANVAVLRAAADIRIKLFGVTKSAENDKSIQNLVQGLNLRKSQSALNEEKGIRAQRTGDEALYQEIIDVYLANLKVIEAICKDFDVTPLYYWQPVCYVDKPATKYEQDAMDRWDVVSVNMGEFYRQAYDRVAEIDPNITPATFHNISGIFSSTSEPVFVDFCHLSEKGNQMVAQRIGVDILNAVKSTSSPTSRGLQ